LQEWKTKDPLARFRVYLTNKGLWDDNMEKTSIEEARSRVDEESQKALDHSPPQLDDVFKYTYKNMPPGLLNQLSFLKKDLGLGGAD
jgi:pyruvate dehydrogenase E1 component alpha subunit